jgi:hypothetical protein
MISTNLANKTIEFKLPDNTIPAEWFDYLMLLWNDCVELLNWRQHYLRAVECDAAELPRVAIEKTKQGDDYYLHCWIGRDSRIDRSKSWDKDNLVFIPQVRLVPEQWLSAPPIEGRSAFTLCRPFTVKAECTALNYRSHRFTPGLLPSGLMQSAVAGCAKSWDKYIKSGAGKPKYKGVKTPIRSFDYDGFRSFCKIDGTRIKLLGMDWIHAPGLIRMNRLIEATFNHLMVNPTDRVFKKAEKDGLEAAARYYAQPGLYRLIRRGNSDYLQLAGEFVCSAPAVSSRAIAIAVGGDNLYSGSNGVVIKNYDTTHLTERIIALQKVLSKKDYKSKNWNKLQLKINELQRQQASAKRKHQQYHAQWLTDCCGEIEVSKVPPVIVSVPVPAPDGKGGYLPNGAGIVSDNNLKAAKVATGQFIEIIKQQGSRRNRIVRVIVDKSPVTQGEYGKSGSPVSLERGGKTT